MNLLSAGMLAMSASCRYLISSKFSRAVSFGGSSEYKPLRPVARIGQKSVWSTMYLARLGFRAESCMMRSKASRACCPKRERDEIRRQENDSTNVKTCEKATKHVNELILAKDLGTELC